MILARFASMVRSTFRPCSATSTSGLRHRSTCLARKFRQIPLHRSQMASRAGRTSPQYEDHVCADETYDLETPDGIENVNLRNAMNEVMRNAYVKDCEIGIKRWNMQIKRAGYDTPLRLPSSRFRRSIGSWANMPVDPDGKIIEQAAYDRQLPDWLPTENDQAFVHSLMKPVIEPGKMAGWIAPPDRGINKLPVDYEYVR